MFKNFLVMLLLAASSTNLIAADPAPISLPGCEGITPAMIDQWLKPKGYGVNGGAYGSHVPRSIVAQFAKEKAQTDQQILSLVSFVVSYQNKMAEMKVPYHTHPFEYFFVENALASTQNPQKALQILNGEIAKQEFVDAINKSPTIISFKARLGDPVAVDQVIGNISADSKIVGRVATSSELAALAGAAYRASHIKNDKIMSALIESVKNYSNLGSSPLRTDEGSLLIARTDALTTLAISMGSKEGLEAILAIVGGKIPQNLVSTTWTDGIPVEGLRRALHITDLEIHPNTMQFFQNQREAGNPAIIYLYRSLQDSRYVDKLFAKQID